MTSESLSQLLGSVFLALAGIAALAGFSFFSYLPSAISRFSDEPEDLYLVVAWISALAGFIAVWVLGGYRLMQRRRLGLPLQLGVGLACAASAGILVSIFRGVI